LAIIVPKNIKIGGNLTKIVTKTILAVF